MRLRLVKEPFDHPDYIFELKNEGFRALVYLQNSVCKLISRNLKTLRFESLKVALAKLYGITNASTNISRLPKVHCQVIPHFKITVLPLAVPRNLNVVFR
jgi:hypothetical protein